MQFQRYGLYNKEKPKAVLFKNIFAVSLVQIVNVAYGLHNKVYWGNAPRHAKFMLGTHCLWSWARPVNTAREHDSLVHGP